MVNIPKIFTYDIQTTPSFNNAFMMNHDFVKLEHIDLFVNNLMDKENILFKNFITGLYPYKVRIIKSIIDNIVIKQQKDGITLDVLIICENETMINHLMTDITKIYYEEKRLLDNPSKNKIKINNCNISFTDGYGYNEDLVIYDEVLHIEKIQRDSCMYRRDGSLMVKSVVFKDYIEDIIKLGFHYEDPNKWTEEMYKKILREKKLERVLKND